MTLKELRTSRKMTQGEAAENLGISLRSYISYENDIEKSRTLKYRYLYQELEKINRIDEEHGILTLDDIRETCADVFAQYDVEYCFLFGSYAKGNASETSDVDLLVSSGVKGLKFYEMAEVLRNKLQKKVDLLDLKQLVSNEELLNEILKSGVKIYG